MLEAASMATPINSGGWSRRFVWASKASELADVGDDGSIKIKADANVMLTLQAHLQVGYNRTLARTSLASPSSSTTPSWGGLFWPRMPRASKTRNPASCRSSSRFRKAT